MSDWQPAVLVNGHNLPKAGSFFMGRVRVRPTVLCYRDENINPCWPEGKWFEVEGANERLIVCEHEILTD